MRYQIYTENKDRDIIEALAVVQFDGFTIIEATGFWQGDFEPSLIIEVISDAPDAHAKMETLARDIKEANHQDAVLLTYSMVHIQMI